MNAKSIAIVGAGFTGLSAGLRLSKQGHDVTIFEADEDVGGLAGSFSVGGVKLEKFYHHWFTNDKYVTELVKELGCEHKVCHRETSTGSYYANRIFRLSSPLDVLRYTPISLHARIRLGLLVLQARFTKDWKKLEGISAFDWIEMKSGKEVLNKVWRPLLIGKFGSYAAQISAVWFWNKLVLRGGSREGTGKEVLAYFEGGFAALAKIMCDQISSNGGSIKVNTPITALKVENSKITGVISNGKEYPADDVICTTPLPIFADLVEDYTDEKYVDSLRRIKYLGNTCLTLELDRSLSNAYWLNVTDPDFPFVGIIEHTNFEPKENYGGKHIVYLSKYLPVEDELFSMSREQLLDYSIPHIKKMFPEFDESWIVNFHVYKANYSQPLVEKYYSEIVPNRKTPIGGLHLATMAQIYPEDRGTNYAIREGLAVAELVGLAG